MLGRFTSSQFEFWAEAVHTACYVQYRVIGGLNCGEMKDCLYELCFRELKEIKGEDEYQKGKGRMIGSVFDLVHVSDRPFQSELHSQFYRIMISQSLSIGSQIAVSQGKAIISNDAQNKDTGGKANQACLLDAFVICFIVLTNKSLNMLDCGVRVAILLSFHMSRCAMRKLWAASDSLQNLLLIICNGFLKQFVPMELDHELHENADTIFIFKSHLNWIVLHGCVIS
ncbi:hypothetical protein Tco_1540621 [Tanacetum coccineum]